MYELHVSKSNLREASIVEVLPGALADGAVRLRIDLFALTANNVTYAVMGSGMLGYWDFFSAPGAWGRLPCWGFGTVVQSKMQEVEEGARFYGYYPVAGSLDVFPTNVGPRGFSDGAPHRALKAPIYNHYTNLSADPAYDREHEAEQALFRPLFGTGFWAADCVRQSQPRAVIISSASCKTALSLAHQLRRQGGIELVGLTSAGNEAYVRGTGLYDRTLTYDAVASLTSEGPASYVDFLGRHELSAAVHRALAGNLTHSYVIGATDVSHAPSGVAPPAAGLVGPTPQFFFVPAYAAARLKAAPELGARMLEEMRAFYPASRAFVMPRKLSGGDAVLDSWQRLVNGEVPPREGLVLSLAGDRPVRPLGLQRFDRQLVGFEQERGIPGEVDVARDPDVFEEPIAEPVSHGDDTRC